MRHISSWFQAAVLPRKWSVAGINCNALSIWHVYALADAGNPYVCGGGGQTIDKAIEVLLYCSGDIEHGRRLLVDSRYMAKCSARVLKSVKRLKFEDLNAATVEYVASCIRAPAHKHRETLGGGKQTQARYLSAPKCWVLVEAMSRGNVESIDAAWNMPFSTAQCLFDARRDASGDDDTLETLDEERRYDEIIEQRMKQEAST